MIKRLLLAAVLAFGLSTPAYALSGLYLELQAGGALGGDTALEFSDVGGSDESFNEYPLIAGAAGINFLGFRSELELTYRNIDSDFQGGNAMFNLWYELPFGIAGLRPFAGGGIGAGYYEVTGTFDGIEVDDDVATFAYNLGAGVAVDIVRNIAFTAGYRFTGQVPGDLNVGLDRNVGVKLDSHELRFGLRFTLG
ncbi:MAG: outer membrane protein [Geminicoccaceae bacterium]